MKHFVWISAEGDGFIEDVDSITPSDVARPGMNVYVMFKEIYINAHRSAVGADKAVDAILKKLKG